MSKYEEKSATNQLPVTEVASITIMTNDSLEDLIDTLIMLHKKGYAQIKGVSGVGCLSIDLVMEE